MQSFFEIDMPEEPPRMGSDRTLTYGQVRIPLLREKTGTLSSVEYYEHAGHRYRPDQASDLMERLQAEERNRLPQATQTAPR